MNVYIISPNPVWGGAATANISIAQMLAGHHLVFYNDEYNDDLHIDGVTYDSFPTHKLRDSEKLIEHIKELNIDCVLWGIAMNLPYYYKASRLLHKMSITQCVLFHSLALKKNLKGLLMERLVAKSIKYIDHLIFVSQYTDNSWSKYKSVRNHQKHVIIYNPIENNCTIDTRALYWNRIGFVGRFSIEKRPQIFAELSVKDVKNEYVAWGNGELLLELKKKYPRVRFMGHSLCKDDIYNSFDILVMTSEFENCPMVILEAWKYGIPCVVPNVGGIPEIVVNGYNGILYDSYSTDTIIECINLIQSNYNQFRSNCLKSVKKYSYDNLRDLWNKILLAD